LAKDMGLDIGDLFYLTFRDLNGMYVSLEMPVSAILYSGDPKANKMKVFMDLKTLQKEMDTNGVSEITILTDDMYKTGKYAEQIKKAFPEFEINDWKSLSYEFANIVKSKKKAGTFILLVILIIAMVGIINTILISIYEKRREIGTLKAMGMLDTEVRNLFIAEGFIIGLSGSVVGLIIGALVNLYFVYHGIDYSAMVDKMGNMGASMVGVIKSAWAPGDFIMVTILCTLSSIFASYYPARKVMKMQPVECLRTI
ncbi:MAG: FtsX-like permease family protein, partial [Spirochaetia bacterium]|nr:FtsX-like permease family protein [Spirochaetia bacterium]